MSPSKNSFLACWACAQSAKPSTVMDQTIAENVRVFIRAPFPDRGCIRTLFWRMISRLTRPRKDLVRSDEGQALEPQVERSCQRSALRVIRPEGLFLTQPRRRLQLRRRTAHHLPGPFRQRW